MPLRAHVILFSLMLTNALKLKSIKVSTNINNNVKLKIIFRSMFRVINNTVPNIKIIFSPISVHVRNYPGEYSHKVLRRNSDNTIIGAFTKTPKDNFENLIINDKELLNGAPVPSNSPGQAITAFKKAKIVEEQDVVQEKKDKPIFIEDKKAQATVDKYGKKIEDFFKNKIQKENLEVRVDKNNSRFYNENGTRDYENFP